MGVGHDLGFAHASELHHQRKQRDLILGLRSSSPPDSVNLEKPPRKDSDEPVEVSDAEWEIRTGRALFVLQETLPDFFKIGLITNVDKSTGTPVNSPSVLPLSLGQSLNPLDFLQHHEGDSSGADIEPLYSPKVKLEYTPPSALPPPFPRTLHIEGLPLYLASASFMRHTMNALYSDLSVTLLKVSMNVSRKDQTYSDRVGEGSEKKAERPRLLREKSLLVRFMVAGKTRVSGSPSEWEVESSYTFSPVSGLIHKQVINSIHPAPHQAVYHSLSKMFSWGSAESNVGKGPAPGTMCSRSSK